MDFDIIPLDDHIEDVVVLESLNTSSEFSEEMDYRNTPDGRITLSMRFRVRCSGGYEGPNCDCLPHNDDVSGHYSCREDGGISCLSGYTNTSNLCRQGKSCCRFMVREIGKALKQFPWALQAYIIIVYTLQMLKMAGLTA